jgi:hypothetical protein
VISPLELFEFVPSVVPATAQITGITWMSGRPTIGMRAKHRPLKDHLDQCEGGETGAGIDEFGRSSLSGVFCAGDMAHPPALPMPMAWHRL